MNTITVKIHLLHSSEVIIAQKVHVISISFISSMEMMLTSSQNVKSLQELIFSPFIFISRMIVSL